MRNIDYEYVNRMKAKNDIHWRNGEEILYFHWRNKEYILPTIVICALLIFIKDGLACDIVVICAVLYKCHLNNLKLDNSPRILKERESYRKFREKNGVM